MRLLCSLITGLNDSFYSYWILRDSIFYRVLLIFEMILTVGVCHRCEISIADTHRDAFPSEWVQYVAESLNPKLNWPTHESNEESHPLTVADDDYFILISLARLFGVFLSHQLSQSVQCLIDLLFTHIRTIHH